MKNITTTSLTRLRLRAGLAVTCIALSLTGAQAGDGKSSETDNNSNHEKPFLMSFNESFTSQTTLDGDVTMTGAISERGTRHEDFAVIHVNPDGSQVVVAGTSTITTASGTVTTRFTGTIYFDLATFDTTQLAYIEGIESITGGTGPYANARGHGTFEATIDYVTGAGIGVFEARVRR